MPQFILAFPLTKEINEPLALTETVTLAADAASVIIPGCSVMFKVIRKDTAHFKQVQAVGNELFLFFRESVFLLCGMRRSLGMRCGFEMHTLHSLAERLPETRFIRHHQR